MSQPSSSHSAEDDNAELFSAVLSALDRERLPSLACAVLQRTQPHHPANKTHPSVGEPIYGSCHVILPLRFSESPHWVVKIPINGTAEKWDELSASALASEASTMLLLKRETTIPLPDVFDFSSTTENILRCPYIIMSFVPGVPLYEVWFGHRLKDDVTLEVTLARRNRSLKSIALAMIQLGKFSFQTGGRLLFGADGKPSGIGSMRQVDHKAMLDRWFIYKDPDDDPIYVECPASEDWRRHYTIMLDLHPEQNPVPRGLNKLLRHLISLIPEPKNMDGFVLAHPDFDIQNFIVSEEGELQGIIDWDGAAAVPRTLGNERYPGWLTRDWDPAMYGFEESMDQGTEPEGVWEDSPECLAKCRRTYKDIMAKGAATTTQASEADFCRMSLITENLAIAANNPQCRNDILRKVVGALWSAAGRAEEEQPQFTDLATMFGEDRVESSVLETISMGFNALLSQEQL